MVMMTPCAMENVWHTPERKSRTSKNISKQQFLMQNQEREACSLTKTANFLPKTSPLSRILVSQLYVNGIAHCGPASDMWIGKGQTLLKVPHMCGPQGSQALNYHTCSQKLEPSGFP